MTSQRIDSWKAIARFLRRDVRTAQRWADTRQLPVRHIAGVGHSVFAWEHELRAWLNDEVAPAGDRAESSPAPRAPGLLVLPFEFRGPGGSDRAFVGDAVAAEVLNRLAVAPLKDLRVLSWTTARAFGQSKKRADELASDLGVRYLVEGAVNEAGSRWSVDVRVVDAAEDRIVLTDRFAASGSDILRLHTTIAEAVSGQLSLRLSGQMLEPFWNDAVDPAAFLAYVRAWRAYTEGIGGDGLRLAIDLAAEAIALDPRFTPAYALKGLALHFYTYYFKRIDRSLNEQAREMARHAISAGPLLATSNVLDAIVATYREYDWNRAEARYGFVLDRLPSDAHARRNLAFNISLLGRSAEAQATLDVARDLDRSPRLWMMQGMLHRWRGEYESAVECFDRVLQVLPNDHIVTFHSIATLGLLLHDEERVRVRVDALDPAMAVQWGPFFDGCIAVAGNDVAGLDKARHRVREFALEGSEPWYAEAMLAGAGGDVDGVVESLSRAIDIGNGEPVGHARVDSLFDCARNDPRFVALLRRINLSPLTAAALAATFNFLRSARYCWRTIGGLAAARMRSSLAA